MKNDDTVTSPSDIRRLNRESAISAHRNGALRLDSKPVALFLELTRRCNLACPMCRSIRLSSHTLDMAPEVIRIVEEQLLPTASFIDLRGWGESTLRADFHNLLSRFAQPGVQIRLVTNGIVADKTIWKSLMAHRAMVAVSIDGTKERTLRRMRGVSLEAILTSVRHLVRWRDTYGVPAHFVSIITAVGRSNADEVPSLIRAAHSVGVSRLTLFPLVTSPDDSEHLSHTSPEEITTVLDTAQKLATSLGVDLQLGCALDESLVLDDRVPDRCIHPWMYCYIDYLGRIGFCGHLIGRSEYTVGNLTDTPIEVIWNGPSLIRLRKEHLERRGQSALFTPCAWCYRNRYVDFEDVLLPTLSSQRVATSVPGPLYRIHSDREASAEFVRRGGD